MGRVQTGPMTTATTTVSDSLPRKELLTVDQIERFWADGFLNAGRFLSDSAVASTVESLDSARLAGLEYDLLDPKRAADWTGEQVDEPQPVGTMFNLWRVDPRLRSLTFDPTLAQWAAQLLGGRQVRVLEDNSLYKAPQVGGSLHWHQDHSYYPLAQPPSVTAWIALDKVVKENGAVQFAVGSHLLGERLPVTFGEGKTYNAERRPSTVRPIEDPQAIGLQVEVMELMPGEVTFHHSLTWHASAANTTDFPRRAFAIRYFIDGAIWLGSRRCNFYYTDDELGLEPGEPAGGPLLPLVPF